MQKREKLQEIVDRSGWSKIEPEVLLDIRDLLAEILKVLKK